MNQPRQPRLLFDENFGRPHITEICHLVDSDVVGSAFPVRPEIKHVLEFQGQGIWDEEWIPQIAGQGWIVISADRAKRGGLKKGNPLPRLCAVHRITHVLLSPKVQARKSVDKMFTILSVWYDLLALVDEPAGSRFLLEPLGNNSTDGKGRLSPRPTPVIETDPPPLPDHLF